MLYLCTSRFDLEVQEAKEFEQFFGSDEIQILVEEAQAAQKPGDDAEEPAEVLAVVDVDAISDAEEQGDRSGDLIDVDDDDDDATIAAAPSHAAPSQVRTSGRKRRHVEDDLYEHY